MATARLSGARARVPAPRLHGLTAALLSLTQSVEEAIIELDDAEIWRAPMFVQEEEAPAA